VSEDKKGCLSVGRPVEGFPVLSAPAQLRYLITELLCRLLRNRVSAQQARERKKCYVTNLEAQVKKSDQTVRCIMCSLFHTTPTDTNTLCPFLHLRLSASIQSIVLVCSLCQTCAC
jgi:hypothetical protein